MTVEEFWDKVDMIHNFGDNGTDVFFGDLFVSHHRSGASAKLKVDQMLNTLIEKGEVAHGNNL